jgi:hypothetical protein
MPSKSKNVRLEQRRILEKKLDLRLQQLVQKGISKEKAKSDPLVKNLRAKIRETNIRIKVADKFVSRTQELAQAKVQKLADLAKKKEEPEPEATPKQKKQSSAPTKAEPKKKQAAAEKEPKPKKKTAPVADEEPEKQKSASTDVEPPKRPRKKKEEPKEE